MPEFIFESNNVRPAQTNLIITLTPYADLLAHNVSAPVFGVVNESTLITWDVTNTGPGGRGNGRPGGDVTSWVDRIMFSPNANFGDGDDVLIAQVPRTGILGAYQLLATFVTTNNLGFGQFLTRTQTVTLPLFGAGDQWLVVRVDSGGVLFETDEGNTATNNSLQVSLISSDTARVTLPATVTIQAGERSEWFHVGVVDNNVPNVPARVTLTATAPGYSARPATLMVLDDDTPSLTLTLRDVVVSEGTPNPATVLTLTRSPVTAARARFSLQSSAATVATLPYLAVIEPNEASVMVPVSVIDNGLPSMSATQQFQITVRDSLPDVVASLGTNSVAPGQAASVPLRLESGVNLTNLLFEVEAIPPRVGNFVLQSPSTDVLGANVQTLATNRARILLTLKPGVPAESIRTLLRVGFTALTNDHSSFVRLQVGAVQAVRNTGTGYLIETSSELGDAAHWEPVLSLIATTPVESLIPPATTNHAFYRARESMGATLAIQAVQGNQKTFRTTGQTGRTYVLECNPTGQASGPWMPLTRIAAGATPQTATVSLPTSNAVCRAREMVTQPPWLDVGTLSGLSLPLTIYGRPGASYRLQSATRVDLKDSWQTVSNLTLEQSFLLLNLPIQPNSSRFYRLVTP